MVFRQQVLTNFQNVFWNLSEEHMLKVQTQLSELPLSVYGELRHSSIEHYSETVSVSNVKHIVSDIYYDDYKIIGNVQFIKQVQEYDMLVELFKRRKIIPTIRAIGHYIDKKATIEKIITWDVQLFDQTIRSRDLIENNPKKLFY